MFITKKEFERRVEERVHEELKKIERERYERERYYELEKRIDNATNGLWREIEIINRKLDGGQKLRPECDELKSVTTCERL